MNISGKGTEENVGIGWYLDYSPDLFRLIRSGIDQDISQLSSQMLDIAEMQIAGVVILTFGSRYCGGRAPLGA